MSDQTGSLIYAILLLVLVGSSLFAHRLSLRQTLRMIITWLLIFATAFILFTFRTEFKAIWTRLKGEVSPGGSVSADGTLRVAKAPDGHFWVDAQVNGKALRFMIDSGATTTSLSDADAANVGVDVDAGGFPVIVETANGTAAMKRGRIAQLRIGNIERREFPVLVSDTLGDTNLLGMNFLSSLKAWRIEGDTLVLNP